MLFFRKRQGQRSNFFRKFYNRFSGFLPFIAMLSLGVFGTSIYYKNQPAITMSQQDFNSTKVEEITNQLNSEKDITGSLSSKNVELKQRLKKALSKASTDSDEFNVTKLNSELAQEKQDNQKLNDENARLKVRINNMLATIEAKNKIQTDTLSEVKKAGNRNIAQVLRHQETPTDTHFNKVKMDSPEDSKSEVNSAVTNRNVTQKKTEFKNEAAKKVIKTNNERTMELKKGESLWNLSKRAYGKGIYYKKIIKANPSITEKNFKRLRPGAIINVPR